jgi:hypothetical protein
LPQHPHGQQGRRNKAYAPGCNREQDRIHLYLSAKEPSTIKRTGLNQAHRASREGPILEVGTPDHRSISKNEVNAAPSNIWLT